MRVCAAREWRRVSLSFDWLLMITMITFVRVCVCMWFFLWFGDRAERAEPRDVKSRSAGETDETREKRESACDGMGGADHGTRDSISTEKKRGRERENHQQLMDEIGRQRGDGGFLWTNPKTAEDFSDSIATAKRKTTEKKEKNGDKEKEREKRGGKVKTKRDRDRTRH